MRLLIVTEKAGPEDDQRDGGARLVESLRKVLGDAASIAQFGDHASPQARWHFRYPPTQGDRFARRLERAPFVADRVRSIADEFTDILYVHTSMQFGGPPPVARTWTFPMFLTPSYVASGESVPTAYTYAERRVLAGTRRVLTPSHFERRQLTGDYGVPEDSIRVVPRGVERRLFPPRVRHMDGPLRVCAVGSIKRQKNTLGLLRTFAALRARRPDARLLVVGPVQDAPYAEEVAREVVRLGLSDAVEFTGHVPPEHLSDVMRDVHVHLSASTCETFGRAIFETLASGIPNVARATGNAAAEYLAHVPYARFYDSEADQLDAIEDLVRDLPRYSAMAAETGPLFDDELLAARIAAELLEADVLAVSDWDGTLFHKSDPERTARCVAEFRKHPVRVVCTARSVDDMVRALDRHGLDVDWIVGCSGAVVADGNGRIVWHVPLDVDLPGASLVVVDGAAVQAEVDAMLVDLPPWHRVEAYQGRAFVASWEASKLRAIVRLLRHLRWRGRVRAFGDGRYDEELLAYFDGVLVRPASVPTFLRQAKELTHA